ncbi:polysialyltransferase family glycosyltransferase [Streptomyces litchfieldiae]|uniref:Polysialyltransferase family glycosyltransferase n=1 Tax=Streptomyces litchfieldiae TaxID=3075543 RepID=A0ABU2MQH8_9ACTN|nr:polysialyltransferase family glycosyltransferase [Streptomyces sp. DSM 44938]MDT0343882.1 polysialyltransferase family glycosyltransferase [Streptomyces sp. DSM 44938]
MTAQVFLATTLYGAATLAAALRSGLFGDRRAHRRLLVVGNTASRPELSVPLDEMTGFGAIAGEFDARHSWNATIAPYHPSDWAPRPADAALWERMLRRAWDLGDGPVEVACESIQVSPARALATIFADAPVHIYADGLMSYGPTRNGVPPELSTRLRRLLHPVLVPGLRPLLLSEHGVEQVAIPGEHVQGVLSAIGSAGAGVLERSLPAGPPPTAVLLGQYLSALGLITEAEEEDLHARMLRGAAARGHASVLFKPHPTAPARIAGALERTARELGVRLTVSETPLLAETLFAHLRPRLVVGCFSTALMTAATLYGVPTARVGTELLLERITPYQNSNRVPLTIVDALLPDLEDPGVPVTAPDLSPGAVSDRLAPLVRAVGYCMQSARYPELRDETAALLRARLPEDRRYFKRRRLTALDLPGSAPGRARILRRNPTVRRAVRLARSLRPAPARTCR